MDVYVVLPIENKSDYLVCCSLNDVSVYQSAEAADYAAYKLNKARPEGARYKWEAVGLDVDVFQGAAA